MDSHAVRLAVHLPRTLRQRLADDDPARDVDAGAVLFIDIAGFTGLSERLAAQGDAGAERLAALLNERFSQLISLVHAYGGDVARFAGDALVAVFPALHAGGLEAAVRLAAACAQACQATPDRGPDRTRLSMSMGAGTLRLLPLPGTADRADFLVVGSAVTQAAAVQHQALPDEVLLSPEAAGCVGISGRLERRPDGTALLLTAEEPSERSPLPDLLPAAHHLARFVPGVVQSLLAAGQAEYIAELRPLSVLFVHIGGVDLDAPDAAVAADRALCAVEAALAELGGALDKMLFDDKGLLAIGVFGLPGQAFEDGPARASLAALAIRQRLSEVGYRASIGVTTGPAFCGSYGGASRREYSVLGHTVNLAARLMAVADGGVLADDATHRMAEGRVRFERHGAIHVKGASEVVPTWRVQAPGRRRHLAPARSEMVGRTAERRRLLSRVEALAGGDGGGVLIVEGEAGVGKSTLLASLVGAASDAGVGVLLGAGDAIEASTAGYAWRQILALLASGRELARGEDPATAVVELGEASAEDRATRRERLAALLGDDARLQSWLPLLEDLLPLGFAATETTEQMAGLARSDSLRDVVVHLLRASCRQRPHLLVVDDAHWLDSASWALLIGVVRAAPELLVVVGTRPLDEPVPVEWAELVAAAGDQHLALGGMSDEEAVAVAARKLGARKLPPAAERLIAARAEGNPLFSEELAWSLHDAGLLIVEDGEARLDARAGDLSQIEFPTTVQGVIGSRIDRLALPQQLGLKVASVIGRVFAYRLLHDIHPVEHDRPELLEHLRTVERAGLTLPERPDPDPAWLFRHALIRDVAYGLMVPSQRARLHASVAAWYEARYADDLEPWLPLLAHHYGRAGDDLRAVAYLEQAGAQALRRFANDEALRFYAEALDRHATLGRVEPERRAGWLYACGEALRRQGRWDEGAERDRQALALLRQAEPRGIAGLLLGTTVQLLRQGLHLLAPGLAVADQAGTPGLRTAAACYQALAQYYYRQNRALELVHASFAATNLADRAGPCRERVGSYGAAGMQANLLGMERLARRYHGAGRAEAERLQARAALGEHAQLVLASAVAVGAWQTAQQAWDEASEIHRALGDRYMWELDASLMGFARMHQGRWDECEALLGELWASAWPHSSPQNQALALLGRLPPALWRDELEAVDLDRVEHVVAQGVPVTDEVLAFGLLALARLRLGDPHAARDLALKAEERFLAAPPSTYYCMTGLAALVQTWIELPAGVQGLPGRAEALDHATKASRALWGLSMLNAVAEPRSLLARSLLAQARGKRGSARKLARAARRSAEALEMPHEVAMAAWQEARCGAGEEASARSALEALGLKAPLRHWEGAQGS